MNKFNVKLNNIETLKNFISDISKLPDGGNINLVCLDDFAGSGNSLIKLANEVSSDKLKSITIAPLTTTKGGTHAIYSSSEEASSPVKLYSSFIDPTQSASINFATDFIDYSSFIDPTQSASINFATDFIDINNALLEISKNSLENYEKTSIIRYIFKVEQYTPYSIYNNIDLNKLFECWNCVQNNKNTRKGGQLNGKR